MNEYTPPLIPIPRIPPTQDGAEPPMHAFQAAEPVVWRSCCFTVNKDMLQFLVTTVVSLTVLTFCLINSSHTGGDERATYMPLVTFIVGVYLPAPRPRTT